MEITDVILQSKIINALRSIKLIMKVTKASIGGQKQKKILFREIQISFCHESLEKCLFQVNS